MHVCLPYMDICNIARPNNVDGNAVGKRFPQCLDGCWARATGYVRIYLHSVRSSSHGLRGLEIFPENRRRRGVNKIYWIGGIRIPLQPSRLVHIYVIFNIYTRLYWPSTKGFHRNRKSFSRGEILTCLHRSDTDESRVPIDNDNCWWY